MTSEPSDLVARLRNWIADDATDIGDAGIDETWRQAVKDMQEAAERLDKLEAENERLRREADAEEFRLTQRAERAEAALAAKEEWLAHGYSKLTAAEAALAEARKRRKK